MTNSHHYNDTNDARLQMNKLYAYPLSNTYTRVIVKEEPMKDKDWLKLLLQNGWKDVRQRGSHHRLKKDDQVEAIAVTEKMFLQVYYMLF